jgi:sterol desaturase/sphingolipid hydroxylase (fatty acid hydroxylase superfamily)
MLSGVQEALTVKLLDVLSSLVPGALLMAVVCTALCLFSSQACDPEKVWWKNRGLLVDVCYWLTVQCLAPYIRTGLLIAFATLAMAFLSADELDSYISNGRGPLGSFSFWPQVALYLVLSDLLLYWIHRIFHGARLWNYHAIHHSAEDVDWTTAYRFHPVNLCLGPFMVDVIMLYLGVAPTVLLYMVSPLTIVSLFVHANLNWSFGPLKYVVATPVFHRWHHTLPDEGGNRNFAPTFAIWDVMFGTFYMPDGRLPQRFGVDDPAFPRGFLRQLIFPFTAKSPGAAVARDALKIRPTAIGSVGPQP